MTAFIRATTPSHRIYAHTSTFNAAIESQTINALICARFYPCLLCAVHPDTFPCCTFTVGVIVSVAEKHPPSIFSRHSSAMLLVPCRICYSDKIDRSSLSKLLFFFLSLCRRNPRLVVFRQLSVLPTTLVLCAHLDLFQFLLILLIL